jgi:hypothetical protein
LDDFLVRDGVSWLAEGDGLGRILWYDSEAMETALAEAGVRVIPAGEDVPGDGLAMACSVPSHGTGKNLQKWNRNLFLGFPPNGARAEQTVGRTHRYGQNADVVEAWYYTHTAFSREAIRKARGEARYVEETTGVRQKLLYGSWPDGIP